GRLAAGRDRYPWQLRHGVVVQPANAGAAADGRTARCAGQCRGHAGARSVGGGRGLCPGRRTGGVSPPAGAPRGTAQLYAAIAFGSVIGSVLRWGASVGLHAIAGNGFPWGTLFVNVAG